MEDLVDCELGFGPLGGLARAAFVKRSLTELFDYRRQAIEEIFGA